MLKVGQASCILSSLSDLPGGKGHLKETELGMWKGPDKARGAPVLQCLIPEGIKNGPSHQQHHHSIHIASESSSQQMIALLPQSRGIIVQSLRDILVVRVRLGDC